MLLNRTNWLDRFNACLVTRTPRRRKSDAGRTAALVRMETLEPRKLLTAVTAAADVQPMDVVIMSRGSSDALEGYLPDNFSNTRSITVGEFANAHNDDAQANVLRNADLILISRNVKSSALKSSSAEGDFWNSLSTPIVLMSGGVATKGGWGWVDTRLTGLATGVEETTVLNPDDPLFAGVNVSSGAADGRRRRTA